MVENIFNFHQHRGFGVFPIADFILLNMGK
jgi:hypothetical protein